MPFADPQQRVEVSMMLEQQVGRGQHFPISGSMLGHDRGWAACSPG